MSKTTILPDSEENLPAGWQRWHKAAIPDIRVLACNYCGDVDSWNYPQHSMPFWYLWRTETPGGQLIFNGEIVELMPGTRVLMPPYTPFATRNSGNFGQYYIHFSIDGGDRFSKFAVQRRPIVLKADDDEIFFAGLKREDISCGQILLIAYMQIAEALLSIPREYLLAQDEVPMDSRIAAALNFMQHASGTTPTNAEIARKIGMSENNFLRLFRLEMKDSPRQYMLRLHLHRCLEMLKDHKLSLDDVAVAGGFADRYHFSKAFRKVYGTSPGRFRRTIRENMQLH